MAPRSGSSGHPEAATAATRSAPCDSHGSATRSAPGEPSVQVRSAPIITALPQAGNTWVQRAGVSAPQAMRHGRGGPTQAAPAAAPSVFGHAGDGAIHAELPLASAQVGGNAPPPPAAQSVAPPGAPSLAGSDGPVAGGSPAGATTAAHEQDAARTRALLARKVLQQWPRQWLAALPHDLQARGRHIQYLATQGAAAPEYVARDKDPEWPPERIPDTSSAISAAQAFDLKGWALDATSLAYLEALEPGAQELPKSEQRFAVDEWRSEHQRVCKHCASTLHPKCYIGKLLRCFTHGFRIPWIAPPTRQPPQINHGPVSKFPRWLAKEGARMLEGCAIARAEQTDLKRSSPLLVVTRDEDCIRGRELFQDPFFTIDGDDAFERLTAECERRNAPPPKLRLVVDLSAPAADGVSVNEMIRHLPLGMASPADLIGFIEPNARGIVIDLERAYWSIPIALEDRPYLGFHLGDQSYQYTTAPFGASCSVWMQSLISAEVLRYMRGRGLQSVVYIDDFGIVVPPGADAEAAKAVALDLLKRLGLKVNPAKVTGPATLFRFLGLWIDTTRMCVTIEPIKAASSLQDLKTLLDKLHARTPVTQPTRALARTLVGRLSWMAALTQGGRCRLAFLWSVAEGSTKRWVGPAVKDLLWWLPVLARWASNDRPKLVGGRLLTQQSLDAAHLVVSDASDTGAGYWHGPLMGDAPLAASAFSFTSAQRTKSSTLREALAVQHFVRHHVEEARGRLVIFCTDNSALAFLLSNGRPREMAATLRPLLDTADAYEFTIMGLFVPRELNHVADALSRVAPDTHRQTITGTIAAVMAAATH